MTFENDCTQIMSSLRCAIYLTLYVPVFECASHMSASQCEGSSLDAYVYGPCRAVVTVAA